jgi:recombination protein RecA
MSPDEARAAFGKVPPLPPEQPSRIRTGSLGLDLALGGGWPAGHISVIYGPPFCGKTTLALSAIAEMQKLGAVAYANLDSDFSPAFAATAGVDIYSLLVLHEIPDPVLWEYKKFPVDFVVVDSVASGHEEFLVSDFQAWADTTMLVVSQVRASLTSHAAWTTGHLKDAPVRVSLSRAADYTEAEVTRNPWQPEKRSCKFRFHLITGGIDHTEELIRTCLQKGLITTQGSWLYVGDQPLGRGVVGAQRALQDQPGLSSFLDRTVRRENPTLNPPAASIK